MIEEIRQLTNKIESTLLAREDYQNKAGLRASLIGDCPRLLDYRLQGALAPIEYNNAIRMERGTWIHLMWTELMSESLGEDFSHGQEFTYNLTDKESITGHPDGYIKSLNAIWELKTVSSNSYAMVTQNDTPIPSHFAQSNLYCFGMEDMAPVSQSIIQYFNMDNGQSHFIVCPYDRNIALAGIEMFRERLRNKESGLIAPRPYNDPTGSPCWFCSKKDECYDGWVSEVKAMTTETLEVSDHALLYDQVKGCDYSRSIRLNADKEEKDLKSKIADYLLSRKINAAKLSSFTIDIKLGTKGNPLVTIKGGNNE